MAITHLPSDDELPDLRTILFPRGQTRKTTEPTLLRRSPRKNESITKDKTGLQLDARFTLSATSSQRLRSPAKASPSKQAPSKSGRQNQRNISLFEDVPRLPRETSQPPKEIEDSKNHGRSTRQKKTLSHTTDTDSLALSFFKLDVQSHSSDEEHRATKLQWRNENAQTIVNAPQAELGSRKPKTLQHASHFILNEARCAENLADSDAHNDEDDEDTDLSGFIVDDDAEISYHGSSDEQDSEDERRARRKVQKEKPRRRLQRGRRKIQDSEDEPEIIDGLAHAMKNLNVEATYDEHLAQQNVEIVDLISPEHKTTSNPLPHDAANRAVPKGTNLFDRFQALKLSPPRSLQPAEIPIKVMVKPLSSSEDFKHDIEMEANETPTTPPATPPRSPTKLKSPSKLLSPSKRREQAPRSPHRQSMDAFWDLGEVNQWNDQFSPKKAPVMSPRKNRLAAFDPWSDAEDNEDNPSFEAIDETSDSLPSPCDSPTKSKSRSASPLKAEKQRLLTEKRARQLEKQHFDQSKDQIAQDLLMALDKHITNSRIAHLSQSTGGVQVIWSKTLRSTAGRANWRRTVTKLTTGSPVKSKDEQSLQGAVEVQHFANIELAVKVIDRPARLINTLAHEFCHLANFMVSNIRDQPHGASFQSWAKKVTTWMKSQDARPEWRGVEVTTKHGYVIEWKYLWMCAGRKERSKAMEYLGIEEDEEGCGAEYGRHSKSIDAEKHRCGRCKGVLVQVRPKPRSSPVKKTTGTRSLKVKDEKVCELEKMVEVIEISD